MDQRHLAISGVSEARPTIQRSPEMIQ